MAQHGNLFPSMTMAWFLTIQLSCCRTTAITNVQCSQNNWTEHGPAASQNSHLLATICAQVKVECTQRLHENTNAKGVRQNVTLPSSELSKRCCTCSEVCSASHDACAHVHLVREISGMFKSPAVIIVVSVSKDILPTYKLQGAIFQIAFGSDDL